MTDWMAPSERFFPEVSERVAISEESINIDVDLALSIHSSNPGSINSKLGEKEEVPTNPFQQLQPLSAHKQAVAEEATA